MLPKQDRVYSRKASDLEQKYDLGGMSKGTGDSSKVSQLEQMLSQFMVEMRSKIYPVGSFYISADETDPTEIFGGTWEFYTEGHLLIGLDTEENVPPEMLQISDNCYVWKRIS